MLGKAIVRSFVAAAIVSYAVVAQAAVNIELVPVGNPGNPYDPETGYGGVAYEYQIGKYEVTAGQYTEFLNAVAATDTYGLYNTYMYDPDWPERDRQGCQIERSGEQDSYSYSVAAGFVDRPVNNVSWGDATRFANWLHNGQGSGDTEDGAYFLNGATSNEALMAVTRQSDATWFIPTDNEWYKAAYHKNDGVTGNYFDYATSSDSLPGNDMDDVSGNNANWLPNYPNDYPIDDPHYTTLGGEFQDSESPYGTFDQTGNVREWTETVSLVGPNPARWMRDRAFNNYLYSVPTLNHDSYLPTYEGDGSVGFRMASVASVFEPLPGDANLDGVVDGGDLSILGANWLGAGKTWGQGDFNDDGTVNGGDLSILGANWLTGAGAGSSFGEAMAGFNVVPEPGTIALLAIAASCLSLGFWRRRNININFSRFFGGNMKLKVILLCVGMLASMCAAVQADAIGVWSKEAAGPYDRWVLTVTPDAGAVMNAFDITVGGSGFQNNGNPFNGETKDLNTDFLLLKNYFDDVPVTNLVVYGEYVYPSVLAGNFAATQTGDYAGVWSSALPLLEIIVDSGAVTDPLAQLSVGSASYAGQPAHYYDVLGDSFDIAIVPEPGTLALLATGLIGLLCYAWRKRK